MRAAGRNPYGYNYDITNSSSEIKEKYANLQAGEEDANADVSIAGRLMLKRIHGKLAFFILQDAEGQIQLYLDKARLPDTFQV